MFANVAWLMDHQNVAAEVLPPLGFDHNPLVVNSYGLGVHKRKFFRFEQYCLDEGDFLDVVRKGWDLYCNGSQMFKFFSKLMSSRAALIGWSKTNSKTQK